MKLLTKYIAVAIHEILAHIVIIATIVKTIVRKGLRSVISSKKFRSYCCSECLVSSDLEYFIERLIETVLISSYFRLTKSSNMML